MLTPHLPSTLGRRAFLSAGAAAASSMLAPFASAQSQSFPIGPQPTRYPSPVWKTLDDRFKKNMLGNTPLVREWTGALWAEGPAWNGVGRYVVFSDIPNNRQMRWDEVTGTVTPFRTLELFNGLIPSTRRGGRYRGERQTARAVRYGDARGEPTINASRPRQA
jgi:gluconolactonase